MSTINVDNDRLEFEAARNVLRLNPGVGGATVELQLKVGRSAEPKGPIRYRVCADLDISRLSQQGRRHLCRMEATYPVSPTVRPADCNLTGFVSDTQLRLADELRQGGDLWFNLTLTVWTVGMHLTNYPSTSVTSNTDGLIAYQGYLDFPVQAGEWTTQLEHVDRASCVEIVIPIPDAQEHAQAVRRLRQARQLLRNNDIDASLGEARKALEPFRDSGLAKSGKDKLARDRILSERFAVMIEDTYSVLCGAAHDDEVTKEFRYSRAEAQALLATVAGLVHRAAAQS